MSKRKKIAKKLKIMIAVAAVLLVLELIWVAVTVLSAKDQSGDIPPTTEEILQQETQATEPSEMVEAIRMPWEEADAKQPQDYTWDEYEALTPDQQLVFKDLLGSVDYEIWKNNAQIQAESALWNEEGAKKPQDYTWAEYEVLSDIQRLAFQDYLGAEAFQTWLSQVQKEREQNPWDEPGAKKPEDYTWEEFDAMSDAQQLAFQDYLGVEAFQAWVSRVQNEKERNPWDEPGAKKPADYTWEEFEALTANQQMAFQKKLGEARFEEWMNKAQNKSEANPWDEAGAKQPADYTWEEYEAMNPEQQMAFQSSLGAGGFEKWMNRVQNKTEANPWEEPGAKKPADYTWGDFESLTNDQQMAFQNYLGDAGFEKWFDKVQERDGVNPWEKPGAKKPADYTWEEFDALSPEQQMAFQSYMGDDGFEQWFHETQEQGRTNPWDKPGAKKPADYTWEEFESLTAEQQMAFQTYLGSVAFETWINQALSQGDTP